LNCFNLIRHNRVLKKVQCSDALFMNILIVTRRYPPYGGGVENQSARVADTLALRGHTVTVLTGHQSDREALKTDPEKEQNKPKVIYLYDPPHRVIGTFVFLFHLTLKMLLSCRKTGVVLTYFINETSFVAILCARLIRVPAWAYPSAVGKYGNLEIIRRRWYGSLCIRAFRSVDKVICQSSSFFEELLLNNLEKHQLSIISNIASPDFFALGEKREEDFQNTLALAKILWCGRLSPEKNPLLVIEAAKLTQSRQMNVLFEIAGGGGALNATIESAIQANPEIARLIIFHPNPLDVKPFFERADIYILTSDEDAMPLVIIEAMAAGIPIIATNVGGIPEMIENEKTGLLIPPGDAEALLIAIHRLCESEKLRNKLRQNAAQYARAKHHPNEIAEQYEKLFDETVGKPK